MMKGLDHLSYEESLSTALYQAFLQIQITAFQLQKDF